PTIRDKAGKWLRRHRRASLTAVVVAMLVLAGLGIAGWWSNAWLRRHNLALETALGLADHFATESQKHHLEAEDWALVATQRFQASQIRQAQQALEEGQVERAQELLRDAVPGPGQRDLRGFAWYYLWHCARRDFDLLAGHRGMIRSLALASDGR